MLNKMKYKQKYNIIVSFGIVSGIMLILSVMCGIAPFGTNSFATWDANIQYLDFYSYFKDVLTGENDIFYTFSKTLGGTNIAVFSYYLASPLNFLLLFFEQSSLHTFFTTVVIIKCSTCAATFSYFLNIRMKDYSNKEYFNLFVVVLSILYGLNQYTISQARNIMWLDGVSMLPLILASVYELVHQKTVWKLSLNVGICILLNWYTGGINCIFSIIWLVLEVFLKLTEGRKLVTKQNIVDFFWTIIRYGCSMLLGVLLSACIFFPTIAAMQKSNRGNLEFSIFNDTSFFGDFLSVIEGYTLGTKSDLGYVSLFCGSIALIGCIGVFVSKSISLRKKVILGTLGLFFIVSYFWQPLYLIFSLLKDASSYYYRYSYGGIFVILFLAAVFYLTTEFYKETKCLIIISFVFSTLLVVINLLNNSIRKRYVLATIICVCATSIVLFVIYNVKNEKIKNIGTLCLCIGFLLEVMLGVTLQINNYHTDDVTEYKEYVENTNSHISQIKQIDDSLYRVSQTTTRNMIGDFLTPDNLTAYYNDGLAFNYWSISGYTSSPDDVQREFLDRMGYRINGENMCIVNTSVLGADSLLGVKYIMSPYYINGLKEVEETCSFGNKVIYENVYALPMAFVYEDNEITTSETDNPFVYQNELFSKLYGEKVDIYIPLEYKHESNSSYIVSVPEGGNPVYGNIPFKWNVSGNLNVNNEYEVGYSCWLSPSVFYIPTGQSNETITIELTADNYDGIIDGAEQFYMLNLEKFSEVIDKISMGEIEDYVMENGYIRASVEGKSGQNLFLSIPYDKGWIITLNDKIIEPELFGDCMYSIPLVDGKNVIQMTYTVQYLHLGIVVSLISVVVLFFLYLSEKRNNLKFAEGCVKLSKDFEQTKAMNVSSK